MKIDTNAVFFGVKPVGDVANRLSGRPARLGSRSGAAGTDFLNVARRLDRTTVHPKIHSNWQPSSCTLPIHNNIPAASLMRQCLVLP
jgi:hypothetical protein